MAETEMKYYIRCSNCSRMYDYNHAVGNNCKNCGIYLVEQIETSPAEQQQPRTVPADNFCATVALNVDNEALTDAEFRAFIRRTLPIVQYENTGRPIAKPPTDEYEQLALDRFNELTRKGMLTDRETIEFQALKEQFVEPDSYVPGPFYPPSS